MKSLIIAALFIVLAMPAYAEEKNADDVAKELAKVMQIDSMLESARQSSANMVKEQVSKMINSFRNNSHLSEEVSSEIEEASQKFVNTIGNSWSSEEAATIYAKALMEGFSKEEMLKVIEHYKSAEGQKELTVVSNASKKLENYLIFSQQTAMEKGSLDFINDLKKIATRNRSNNKIGIQQAP